MGWVIGLFIVVAIIIGIIEEISKAGLWEEIFFGIALITAISVWWYSYNKDQAKKAADRESQKALERKQLAIRGQAQDLITEAEALLTGLPNNIEAGERALDDAEVEFREGAFAPFWDAVERAINHLGYFDQGVQNVVNKSNRHKMLIVDHKPVFALSIDNLPDARITSARMQRIVRKAQKNFQFATIYEQRKTNQILVAGFGSLAEALNNMSDRIEESINCLSDTISVSFEKQSNILHEIKGSIESEGKERKDHEKKEREMLDNIQRRRKPIL